MWGNIANLFCVYEVYSRGMRNFEENGLNTELSYTQAIPLQVEEWCFKIRCSYIVTFWIFSPRAHNEWGRQGRKGKGKSNL